MTKLGELEFAKIYLLMILSLKFKKRPADTVMPGTLLYIFVVIYI